jgi:hypothetical protein
VGYCLLFLFWGTLFDRVGGSSLNEFAPVSLGVILWELLVSIGLFWDLGFKVYIRLYFGSFCRLPYAYFLCTCGALRLLIYTTLLIKTKVNDESIQVEEYIKEWKRDKRERYYQGERTHTKLGILIHHLIIYIKLACSIPKGRRELKNLECSINFDGRGKCSSWSKGKRVLSVA